MNNPNTEVHFLKNVPFLNNYNHTRLFKNKDEQYNYFSSRIVKKIDDATYQRINKNILVIPYPVDEVRDITYMMFRNTNTSNKWYYAFVLDVIYSSEGGTTLIYELDVFQTFMFDFNFLKSHVDREHQQRYFTNNLGVKMPTINLEEEGLNYGTEYDIIDVKNYNQHQYKISDTQTAKLKFMVFVTAENIIQNTYGGYPINGIEQNFYYYVYPMSNYQINSINDETTWTSTNALIEQFTINPDYVGKLVNCYVTSYFPGSVNISYSNGKLDLTISAIDFQSNSDLKIPVFANTQLQETSLNLGNKYDTCIKYPESKLLMYPYTLLELTDFKGNTFTIKPEMINNDNLTLSILSVVGCYPKSGVFIDNYNLGNNSIPKIYPPKPYLIDNGIIDTQTNDIPIIDDYTASYVQGNKNVLNTTAVQATDNANRNIQFNNMNNNAAQMKLNSQSDVNDIRRASDSLTMAGQVLTLNVGGAVNTFANQYQQMNDIAYAKGDSARNTYQANENARISAEQLIGMQDAKMQDINNIPATVSKQGGNMMFNYGNNIDGFYLITKTLKTEYVERLSNYFNMFGNKVNEYKSPNLYTRESWNYIKTTSCNITGDIPQKYILILRNIFDTGITLWHTDDIYNYELNNNEI